LEKNYQEDMEEKGAVKLGVQALLEVVDSGAKNMEICVVRQDGKIVMGESDVEEVVKEIEKEIEESKKAKQGASSGGDE
jgi:20S proteasome subunit alpha 4